MARARLTITVDKELLNEFKHKCKQKDIKLSTKINTLIKKWLEENGENKS